MISNCGHDENGRYSGGKAGDQTGTEWQVINWYSRPWKCVLRHPDAVVPGYYLVCYNLIRLCLPLFRL